MFAIILYSNKFIQNTWFTIIPNIPVRELSVEYQKIGYWAVFKICNFSNACAKSQVKKIWFSIIGKKEN